jgi:hypothetical protein
MLEPGEAVLDWLLDERFPALRRLTLLQLLGRPRSDRAVVTAERALDDDPWIPALLGGPTQPVHAYRKWIGAHWRLIALAELGVTVETPGAGGPLHEAFDETTAWLLSGARARRKPLAGRYRVCGSQEGGALWAAARLGFGTDPRAAVLAEHLVRWQWPDGGWNCDIRPEASHASFNESWQPLGGLAAYRDVVGAGAGTEVDGAIDAAAEFLLRHRVVESERTGELAHPRLELLRWPPYWHYGLLPGLQALRAAGRLAKPAVRPALDRLLGHRDADGRWRPNGRWWRAPGARSSVETLDWGTDGESRMLTLQALGILST